MGSSNTEKSIEEEKSKAKIIWGTIILVTGFLSPLFIPLVTQSNLSIPWKTTLSGLLALGIPELFMLIAIAIMGKAGYTRIKTSILIFFKRNGPPKTVGKTRYTIGLILFSIILLFGIALPYIINHFPILYTHIVTITLVSDGILILSILILGGDFWDKLRSLYIYNSRVVLIQKPNDEKVN